MITQQLVADMAKEAGGDGIAFRWERLDPNDSHDYQHDFRHAAREALGEKDVAYSWGTRIVGDYLCLILTTA